MDMDMGGMSMGGMDMGNGVPSLFSIQRMYWAVIGAVIAFATLVNLLENVQRWQRLYSNCARPKSWFWTAHATTTAICREINSASPGSFSVTTFRVSLPPLGRVILVLSNLVVVLVLCFYKLKTTDQWAWEDIGYRTGFVAICQLPLVFLLAGKENIIGALTGLGYERLNWLHRWVARTLWLTVTIHMGFWFRSWGRYNYISSKIAQDPISQRGLAAWAILTFIVLTSWMPIRRLNYEVFVITHLVTFSGFIGAVWIHVPNEVKVWVWIPIGLFFFDRLMRARRVAWANITFLHPLRRRSGAIQEGIWANKATLTPLPGNITRISIPKPAISWEPGQHVFLACHSVVPLQAHPFTIATLPSDGKMDFYVKAEKGGTKRFRDFASKTSPLPSSESLSPISNKHVSIEGPYGRTRPLYQFDSVVFFAGSTGATFTLPQMRDLVYKWREGIKLPFASGKVKPVTRRIRFVWVIKSRDQLTWFRNQLEQVIRDTKALRLRSPDLDIDVDISIYVTCDEELVASKPSAINFSSKQMPHGVPKEVEKESTLNSEKGKDVITEVRSTTSSSVSTNNPSTPAEDDITASGSGSGCCQPDGTCCCRTTLVEDESEAVVCTCGSGSGSGLPRSSSSSLDPEKRSPGPSPSPSPSAVPPTSPSSGKPSSPSSASQPQPPPLKLLSGRPYPPSIIRKVLEEACGETAVVVCGPRGLRDDVRNTVVRLCDERAVCKGTGAFGVFLWGEGYEY